MTAQPLIHVWSADLGEWVPRVAKSYDGDVWRPGNDYTSLRRTGFTPEYFAANSVFTRSVADMPLATKSADFAAWMQDNVNYGSGFGPTALNTSKAGTRPIQLHVVDSRLGSNVAYMNKSFLSMGDFAHSILSGAIPWPTYDVPLQPGQDSTVAIYDVATGIYREYYYVSKIDYTENVYDCVVGGFSIFERGSLNLGEQNYAMQVDVGGTSVVRMHNNFGFIGVQEVLNGEINHALAFTCANMNVPTSTGEAIDADGTRYDYQGVSWPAISGDGDTVSDDAPIHGQWARLPEDIDLSEYVPMTRLLIKAAQTYGLVATDTNNFVHAFNTEHGAAWEHYLGLDPWMTDGLVHQRMVELCQADGIDASQAFYVGDFPWHLTEWAPRNWGKPDEA